MSKYAKIKDGVVVNIIEASSDFINSQSCCYHLVKVGVGIGWHFDGVEYSQPAKKREQSENVPFLHLEADRENIVANNTDFVKITATLRSGPEPESEVLKISCVDYAQVRKLDGTTLKAIAVEFIDGVATVQISIPNEHSAKYVFGETDTTKYNLKSPLSFWALSQ